MSKLNSILEKLREDELFTDAKGYDVNVEQLLSRDILIVKRKLRPLEDRLTYNPSTALTINYNDVDFCFKISVFESMLSTKICVQAIAHDALADNVYKKYGHHTVGGIDCYTQEIPFYGIGMTIDVDAIKKYIANTEWVILQERTNASADVIVASNCVLCPSCAMKKRDGYRVL